MLLDFRKEKVNSLGERKIMFGIVEENLVLKDWYTINRFVHMGTNKFNHLSFTMGYMEWKVKTY